MSSSISLNPMQTTTAAGLFSTNSNGFTQGDALDDPAIKFQLVGGVLALDAATPVWGGVPISEKIGPSPAGGSPPYGAQYKSLGNTVYPADAGANNITGYCVFNQAYGGITTPQSTAPLYSPGMSVNYYRLNSGARIPLPVDPALLTLEGSAITPTINQLSWDFAAGRLVALDPTLGSAGVTILYFSTANNLTVAYDGMAGTANWVTGNPIAVCLLAQMTNFT